MVGVLSSFSDTMAWQECTGDPMPKNMRSGLVLLAFVRMFCTFSVLLVACSDSSSGGGELDASADGDVTASGDALGRDRSPNMGTGGASGTGGSGGSSGGSPDAGASCKTGTVVLGRPGTT